MGTKKGKERARGERELESSRSRGKKNRLVIVSAVIVVIIGVSVYFAMSGGNGGSNQGNGGSNQGNGGSNQSNGPIEATWIEPQVVGDTVSIPVSDVENSWNIHFNVELEGEDMNFMAFVVDEEIYVRANVCPPCQSIGFSLEEAVLICDRCATTFEAQTGEGIDGACVDYPKASVPYEVSGGNIVMNSADLIAAYEDTLEPGLRGNGSNGGDNQSNGPIEATWIEPQVVGDTVSIPVSDVENSWNIHFNVELEGEDMNFMAFVVDEEIYVRANVCPPCQSIGFSLEEAILICDRCATTFESETGEGIRGACVDFPKASVPYEIDGGSIIMKDTDLIAAYEDTLEPGWP